MLKVTHKCQPSNRGTERLLLWYLPAWHWRSWHGSPVPDPAINYLPRHRDAEWIVFPTAVDARAHWYASLDATFRREFILSDKPAVARLRLRALRRAEVKVNGVSIQLSAEP